MIFEENDQVSGSIRRLRWACRRGMLELDMLLGNFLDSAYAGLTGEQRRQFVALLTHADPVIFDWLMGHAQPSDADMRAITQQIRHHAQSSVRI